jgi:hypothetical protein
MLSISEVFRSQLKVKFWLNMWYRNFIIYEENKFKTYDELKNQLNCKLNFLKYFSLISMIKSKNVTNITNAEYEFFIPILTKNVFVGKVLWRSLYWKFFSFESFVTRYKLQKTSLKLICVSISDFHLEMPTHL